MTSQKWGEAKETLKDGQRIPTCLVLTCFLVGAINTMSVLQGLMDHSGILPPNR